MLCAHVKPLYGSSWRSISFFFFLAFHNVKTIVVTAKIIKIITLTLGRSAPMSMLRSKVESSVATVMADGVDLVALAVDSATLAVDSVTLAVKLVALAVELVALAVELVALAVKVVALAVDVVISISLSS